MPQPSPANARPEPAYGGIKAAHLTLDILEMVSSAPGGMGVSELAEQLGFTKSSVFRHLHTLVERGYLRQDAQSARYSLGMRAALLARLAAGEGDLVAAAKGPMRQLRDAIGQTVTLAAVGPRSILVVERLLGFDMMEIGIRPGSVLPLHASAHGKVAMAFGRQRLADLARSQPVPRLTPFTVTDWSQIEAQVELTRQQGWCSSPQEIMLGVNAVSAPIFDRSGECVGALAIVGSIQFVPPQPKPEQLEALLVAAREVSEQLGFAGPR